MLAVCKRWQHTFLSPPESRAARKRAGPTRLCGVRIAEADAVQELRILEVDGDAERAQALHALQFREIEILDLAGERAEALQILDVAAVFLRLGVLAVDDGDLPGLGHPLGRAVHDRLVDSLLDDFVADVVGAIDVEALLVETKADRERRVLHED